MKNWFCALLMLFVSGAAMAAEEISDGQTLYLPVYSYIWHGDRVGNNKPPLRMPLSALVSIRNTSLKTSIRIISARYYSTEGKLLNEYISQPTVIKAMGTIELFVERKESEGGSGANFVIQWDSVVPTNPPMVEAVHADIRGGNYALTFITTAHPIQADK
ncbi:MAG: DUF3124 domain-containing protein [Gallionella sp.]|jgi:hypothetical protein